MKSKFLLIILLIILSLNLASCNFKFPGDTSDTGSDDTSASDVVIDKGPEKGGTVKLFSTNPDTLNPLFTKNPYVHDLTKFIFEGLVTLDSNSKPVPCLADSWEVSENKLEWTFHLRKSVLWHDKMPLTADDVVYTYQTIRGSLIDSVYKSNLTNLVGVSAIDKHTVKIKLVKPNSFMAELLTIPVLPKHKYSRDDNSNLRSRVNMTPVGTGPFRFSSFKENANIFLKANANWWNKKQQDSELEQPYLQTINIRIYTTLDQALNSFHIGEVDAVPAGENTGNKYSYRNDLIIRTYTDRSFEFLVFNMQHPLLGNPDVRKALAYAINKSKLVNNILPGEAVPADLPITPDTWLYNTDIIHYVPDSVETSKLLKKSGWVNKDGVLTKNKSPMTLELLVNSTNQTRLKAAEEIKKQLAEAGIQIVIKLVDVYTEKRMLNNKTFDMALLGSQVSTVPDISFLYSSANSLGGYKNPEVDTLLNNILLEHDEEKKKSLFSDLKRDINEDIPYIGLYFKSSAIIYNKKLKGDMSPSFYFKHYNIAQWYIPGSAKQEKIPETKKNIGEE